MTDLMLFISQTAAGCVRAIVCLFLIFRLLSAQKPGKKGITAVIVGCIVISFLSSVTGLPDYYRMGSEAVWFAFCAARFQKADTRMSLFIGIFYEIAVFLWQFLFTAWIAVLLRYPTLPDTASGIGLSAVWLLHTLLAVLMLYLAGRREFTAAEASRLISVLLAAGFMAVIALSEQPILAVADDTITIWTILSVVLMMSVLVFRLRRQYEAERELAKLKSEQAGLLERDYTTLNRAYEINAKLFHDLHNHIGVLQQLLSHQKTEEALQYLNELQAPVREMADTIWTGEETADYLINSKMIAAKSWGITLQIQVEYPRHTDIRSADLCAILGNFLDNALEAARQVTKPEQKFIRLTIRRINQMLVIKCENGFAIPPVEKDRTLQTTKQEGGLHGWGLKSAQTAAEKYDGTIQTSYADNIFRTVATLSYQCLSTEEI